MKRLVALVVLSAVAGCGGGGGGASGPPPSAPLAPPAATPTPATAPASFTAASTTALSLPAGGGVAPVSVPLPASGGFGGTAVLPIAAASFVAGTQLTQTLTNVVPTDAGLLSVTRSQMATSTVALYLKVSVTNPVTLGAPPSFTFNVPAGFMQPSLGYYLAFFDGGNGGWQRGFGGPATGGPSALSIAGAGTVSFQPGITYYFALYGSITSPATPPPATSAPATSAPATSAPATPTPGTTAPTATAAPNTPPPGFPPTVPTPVVSVGPTPGITIGTPGVVPPPPPGTPGGVVPTPAGSSTPGGVGITITVPTPAPIIATPSTLTAALGQTVTATLAQALYGGGFSADASNCTQNPQVVASVLRNDLGAYVVLSVTALSGHGACSISISSLNGGTGSVPVFVP